MTTDDTRSAAPAPVVLPSRRWPAVLAALIVGAAAGAAGLWFATHDDADPTVDEGHADDQTVIVEAESRDLRSFEEWDATLQSGPVTAITAAGRGTLTRTSAVGDRIAAGTLIAEIDGVPVVALYGSVPMYRELEVHSDDGADIRQLEENLVAMGFDPDGTVTVDDNYTVNTGLMVERWEEDLGFDEPDSVVEAGQVVFIDGPSEVSTASVVGSQVAPGQQLLSAITLVESGYVRLPDDEADLPAGAATEPISLDSFDGDEAGRPTHLWMVEQGSIQLAIQVDRIEDFPAGLDVEVELPDESIVDARVDTVDDVARRVATGQGQETVTVVDVTIQPVAPLSTAFTAGPVIVRVEDDTILGATLVPARALIALTEGGHAIDIDGRGLVAVEIGAFDDGWVEITNGAIEPGERLLAPA